MPGGVPSGAAGKLSPVFAARLVAPFAAGYFMSLFFRSVNAVIAPDLVAELQLRATDLGLLTSVYFLTFALFQIPLGLLLDRFGARRVQAVLTATAAGGGLLFALGRDLPTLAVARGLVGLGFAGALVSSYKQFADWLPKERVPLVTGLFLGAGSLGAVVATVPAQLAVDLLGWRGMLAGAAVVTLLSALALLLIVPERPTQSAVPSLGRQVGELFSVVWRDRLFWRIAPMTMLGFGCGSAIQSLWAGPWLRDVAGFDRATVAQQLLVMTLALSIGSACGGLVAERLRRHRISVLGVAGAASCLFMAAELGIALRWVEATMALWILFGATFNVITLTYAALSQHFGATYAGRATAGMNVLSTACAFVLQFAIGAIIDLWPRLSNGGYHPDAYSCAFALLLACQVIAFAWFLLNPASLGDGGDRRRHGRAGE